MRRTLCIGLVCAAVLGGASVAHAQTAPYLHLDRKEFGWLPLIGGDSDLGYGAGAMVSYAGFEFPYEPYQYRLEGVALALGKLVRPAPSEPYKLVFPHLEFTFKADFPMFLADPLRLIVGARYSRQTQLLYPGVGNASRVDPDAGIDHTFERSDPKVFLALRIDLPDPFAIRASATYTRNIIDFDETNSTLARDLKAGSSYVQSVLLGTEDHSVLLLEYSAFYDTRDNETATEDGMYHQVMVQHSPAAAALLPHQWFRVNLTARFYASLGEGRLVLASRSMVDMLFGEVPFYEMARAGDKWAIGSAVGVRGIPLTRYYGRAKVIQNIEVRLHLFRFIVGKARFKVGLVGFGDAGHVWSDYQRQGNLDSGDVYFKYGVGGGLRLQQGEVFIIRADVAWSPWASPIGFYFGAGQVF